jgi:hypothetical protein
MSDRQMFCSECGAEGHAGCDCAAEYISAAAFAARAIARNPEKSNSMLAAETGVGETTFRRARAGSPFGEPEKRRGKDGKMYKAKKRVTRPATKDEAPQFPASAYRHIDTRTGENISRTEAIKREAAYEKTRDIESEVIELRAEVARLTYELAQRPSMDDLRRIDAVDHHAQRITTDIETHNLLRRCLHPDSRNSVSDEILHKAWLAFRNLEALTYDKSKIPPPLPKDLNELWRMKEAAKEARKRSRAPSTPTVA